MSFGFGIGDFIAVVKLGRTVYIRCRDSPSQYRRIAKEAENLSNALQNMEDLFHEAEFDSSMQRKILESCEPSRDVLEDLNSLLDEYQGMSLGHKSVKDAILWDEERTRDITTRIISAKLDLLALHNSLHGSVSLEVLRTVKTLVDEFRAGNLETDSLSSFSVGDYEDRPVDEGWRKIGKDLEMRGFSHDAIYENRNVIVECVIKAISDVDEEITALDILDSNSSTPAPITLTPVSSIMDMDESSTNFYSRPFIKPLADNLAFVPKLAQSWTSRDWHAVQMQLQPHIQDLTRAQETGLLPRAIHLQAMAYSYQGKFKEAKHLLEQSVSPVLHRSTKISFDVAYIAGAKWLGEACLQLKERSNAILAWSLAIQQAGVFAYSRQTLIGNSNDLLSLLYLFETTPNNAANIDDHDIFAEEDASVKKSIVIEALQFVKEHRSLILKFANPLKSSSEESHRITEAMLNSSSYWDWRFMVFDPFFYSSGAARLLQQRDSTTQPASARVSLQLLRDGIHTTTAGPEKTRQSLQNGLKAGTHLGKTTIPGSGVVEIKCGQLQTLPDAKLLLPLTLYVAGVAIVSEALLDVAPLPFPSSLTSVKLITRFEAMSRLFPVRVGDDVKPAMPGSEAHRNCKVACSRVIKQAVQNVLRQAE